MIERLSYKIRIVALKKGNFMLVYVPILEYHSDTVRFCRKIL